MALARGETARAETWRAHADALKAAIEREAWWHLAASDGARSAKEIVDLYAKRWTIEPSFRDTKDLRFGMGMAELRIGDPMRRDRLVFLNALAVKLLTLLGAAGESLGMDKDLRTSTVKRRTHSLFRQGCMWFVLIPNMPEIVRPRVGSGGSDPGCLAGKLLRNEQRSPCAGRGARGGINWSLERKPPSKGGVFITPATASRVRAFAIGRATPMEDQ